MKVSSLCLRFNRWMFRSLTACIFFIFLLSGEAFAAEPTKTWEVGCKIAKNPSVYYDIYLQAEVEVKGFIAQIQNHMKKEIEHCRKQNQFKSQKKFH